MTLATTRHDPEGALEHADRVRPHERAGPPDRGAARPRARRRRGRAHERADRRSTTSTPSARSCGRRASARWASSSPSAPARGARPRSAASRWAPTPPACAALAGGADVKAFFVRKDVKAHGLQRRIEGPLLEPARPLPDRRGRRHDRRLDAAGDRGGPGGGPRDRRRRRDPRPPGRAARSAIREAVARAVRGARDDRRRLPGPPGPRRLTHPAGGAARRDERAGVRAHADPALGGYGRVGRERTAAVARAVHPALQRAPGRRNGRLGRDIAPDFGGFGQAANRVGLPRHVGRAAAGRKPDPARDPAVARRSGASTPNRACRRSRSGLKTRSQRGATASCSFRG